MLSTWILTRWTDLIDAGTGTEKSPVRAVIGVGSVPFQMLVSLPWRSITMTSVTHPSE